MTLRLTAAERKSLTDAVHTAARDNMTAGRTDRKTAEDDAAALYAAAGFSRPAFIWYESPVALGFSELYRTFELPFAHLPRSATVMQMIEGCKDRDIIEETSLEDMIVTAKKSGRQDLGPSLALPLAAFVADLSAKANAGAEGLALLKRQLLQESPDRRLHSGIVNFLRRLSPFLLSILEESPCAPRAGAGFALDEQLCALTGKTEEQALLGKLRRLSAGTWCLPYQRACLMSERPAKLGCDDLGFLHDESGPALVYPGNLAVYFFSGIAVPAMAVTIPTDDIQSTMIYRAAREGKAELERVLSLRVTHQRCFKPYEYTITDSYGRLHCRTRPHMPDVKILHVTNSTAEPDGSFKEYRLRVPPEMLSPLQAVAWTFNMRPEEYLKTQRMT
jgi:hypothetical protein